MSSSTVEKPLPPSWGSYGYVVGRVIQAVGDDADADDLPGAKPVTGSGLVTFTSLDGTRVVTDTDSGQTAVIPQSITCDLDEDGYISMQSKRGIWLWAGNWKVSWGSQVGLPSWSYTVLGTETATAPLQLMSKMGVTPPSGAVITTVKIDASVQPGQALTLDGTGAVVVGVDVTEGMAAAEQTAQAAAQTATDKASAASDSATAAFGSASQSAQSAADALNAKNTIAALNLTASATQVAAGGAPTASVTGTMPNLALSLGIPAGQPSTYELRGSGSPYNSVTPPGAGYYYTDTAGTCGAWRWMSTGTTKTSWTPLYGNTGVRQFSSYLQNVNTAQTYNATIQRINNTVTLVIGSAWLAASTGMVLVTIPAGFSLPSGIKPGLLICETNPYNIILTTTNGQNIQAWWASGVTASGNKTSGTLTWPCTDTWPTTLPTS